jgi:hypothetical protein
MSDMICLFVSYAHEDKEAASHLVSVLKRFDVPHFIDTDVRTNHNFVDAIDNALKITTHFIILVSRNSMSSAWVHSEIDRAKKLVKEDHIFPIVLGDDVPLYPTFPPDIKYLQLNPAAIDEDQLARDLVDYLFDPDGVVPYKLFQHYGKRLPSEVFAAELLSQPVVLCRKKDKLIVRINRDEVKNVVISNRGKNVTLCDRYVTPRRQEWIDLDIQIQQLIAGTSKNSDLMIPTIELPLRWASGGVLSLITCGGKIWVPLFFRDIAPVGWNVSLGSTERCFDADIILKSEPDFSLENELSEPWKFLLREFLEETLIIDRPPRLAENSCRRVFQFDGSHKDQVSQAQADLFVSEHVRLRNDYDGLRLDKAKESIELEIVNNTDMVLTITGHQEEDHIDRNVLVVINPLELGIEVIKVFEYEIKEDEFMLDGEILITREGKNIEKELVRMPFALISLEYLWHAFGKPGFVPDFTDEEKLPAVKGSAPFSGDDLKLFGWDVLRRRQIVISPEQKKGKELDRYQKWCDNFATEFEKCLETGDPSGLPYRFTPSTAKVINTYFNCSSHGRQKPAEFAAKSKGS